MDEGNTTPQREKALYLSGKFAAAEAESFPVHLARPSLAESRDSSKSQPWGLVLIWLLREEGRRPEDCVLTRVPCPWRAVVGGTEEQASSSDPLPRTCSLG